MQTSSCSCEVRDEGGLILADTVYQTGMVVRLVRFASSLSDEDDEEGRQVPVVAIVW